MANPFTWAGGPAPSSEAWVPESADRSGGVSTTGSEQIVSSGSSRWRATLTFQLQGEKVLWMRRLILAMKGRSGTVLVGPFDTSGLPIPNEATDQWAYDLGLIDPMSRTLAETDVVGEAIEASLRANAITIYMPPNRTPFEGNYIGIGARLHVLTSVQKNSDGGFTCGIEPLLRSDVPHAAPVYFNKPVCTMRFNTPLPLDSLKVTGGDHITNVTLDLVEAF